MTAHAMTYGEPLCHVEHASREPAPARVSGTAKSDSQLIAMLRQGDERAFEALVKQNHGALIRMAMRYVADRDTAEEVVQDTWIAVIEGISRFEGRSSLESWMFAILIHKAKDRGVRESRQITFSAFDSHDDEGEEAVDPARFHASGELAGHWALPPQPWNEQTPERLLASRQAFEALSNAVDELPAGLRDVLVLKDVEGLESQEICKRLKITDTNLYVRLHRARERVRQAVEISLHGNGHRDVSNCGFATLMSIAQAISRKPCPLNEKRAESRVGSW
jgi:RNA polymerase sigma-70 factor (ECF subfamily)